MTPANARPSEPTTWDPDEHWERGHRELRKLRAKQAVPYVAVAVGILALVVWAVANEPEAGDPPSGQVPVTVPDPAEDTGAGSADPGDGAGTMPDGAPPTLGTAPRETDAVPLPVPLPVPVPNPGEPVHDS
jgi:hypothetical protein